MKKILLALTIITVLTSTSIKNVKADRELEVEDDIRVGIHANSPLPTATGLPTATPKESPIETAEPTASPVGVEEKVEVKAELNIIQQIIEKLKELLHSLRSFNSK